MRTIFYNGYVYTGDPEIKQAFSVEDGHFSYVGDNETVLSSYKSGDILIDLKNKFVCAAFNDSHMHLLGYSKELMAVDLTEHTDSIADIVSCLSSKLDESNYTDGQWLTGWGWTQDKFHGDKRMPTRYDLDKVSEDIPIMINHVSGHCCIVNSKLLKIAGLQNETGCLNDDEMKELDKYEPVPDKQTIKNMIYETCKILNSKGITSVQTDDYCIYRCIPTGVINQAYKELENENRLTVRIYEQCNLQDLNSLKEFIEGGNVTGKGTDMFRIGPLKLIGDGALGSRTAHLSEHYLDDENNYGHSLYDQKTLNQMIEYANEHGMQIAVHAIGDKCLDEALDAYESVLGNEPEKDHRHGIVHCQITRKDQLERIKKLHLHVYAQSVFLNLDIPAVRKLVAPDLSETSYNWKTLLDMGVSVSNGTDCPVEKPDILRGIEYAVTRCSDYDKNPYLPNQRYSVSEAIDSFTIRSAESSFDEKIKGKIKENYLADFVILDDNPFNSKNESIHEITISATYLNGKCVYSRT
jgi:predicted amidohydrolase YtcJ